jgi:diaminopimelate decarboxylase
VIAAGGSADKTVFSGVGKSQSEMRAALAAGIDCFNVESVPELERLNEIAGEMGAIARISLRINPDIDSKTHPYISTGLKSDKFGIAFDQAQAAYRMAATMPGLNIIGITCHIGSQITELAPYLAALDKMLTLVDTITAEGIEIEHINIGGGLGIRYENENPPEIDVFVHALLDALAARGHASRTLCFEPGRSLVGQAGILLTRIEYLKTGTSKHFAIVDAAMNDFARPALYEAWHDIVPITQQHKALCRVYDVVGPVCESGDCLGRARPLAVAPGDLLAVSTTGAYGFSMSSNYNTRPRAAEVMVDGETACLVRARETIEQLFADEARVLHNAPTVIRCLTLNEQKKSDPFG